MKKIIVFLGMVFLLSVTTASAGDTFEALFAGQQTVDGTALEGSWIISKDPQVLYFTNIEPANQYTVVILKGLKAASGSRLEMAGEFSVTTRGDHPAISFADKGFILASRLNQDLPVISMNIDKADIDFFRIKPDFIDEFRSDFSGTEQMYYHYSGTLKKYAELLYTGRWDIQTKKDLRDVGLHARRYQNRLQFQSQSLETARPLENVTIDGYHADGNVLFDTRTDSNGLAVQAGAFEDLAYIIARSGDSVNILPMNLPALNQSEFPTAVEPFRPVVLYVYGPRDLYRPGETLTLDGLLRNQDGEMTVRIPVSGSVIQPDGRVVHEFTWKGRKYSPQMHDLYQDLIEPNKREWARLRFGGDMAALARGKINRSRSPDCQHQQTGRSNR